MAVSVFSWQDVKTRPFKKIKMRLYHLIIHVFGEVQGPPPPPPSTWDLDCEYFKNIFECTHKPQLLTEHGLQGKC